MKQVIFIIPIIRTDYIKRCLETLRKYTDRSTHKIILIDQSWEGLQDEERNQLYKDDDMYIRMRNVGFAKAVNEGIIHGLKWGNPYIGILNDDVEQMYYGWFPDLLEEFKTDEKILAVCPESPRSAMWGYGLNNGEHLEIIPYKEQFNQEDIAYLKQGDYNKEEIQSRHDFKIPDTFPFTKRGVIDGIAMWSPIFKREAFIELGLFDERFVWGGAEDYCMLTKAYSCAFPIDRIDCDPRFHRRMVSTMKSWSWHWWSRSKDQPKELNPNLFTKRKAWNNLDMIFPPEINGDNHSDPWGHWTDKDGKKKPFRSNSFTYMDPE